MKPRTEAELRERIVKKLDETMKAKADSYRYGYEDALRWVRGVIDGVYE